MSSVDVIVPCYRYGHFLQECVESVLSQHGVDVRVLIIDDASPDNTAEVATALAKSDPRVTFVRHQTNLGHIGTYNEGIEWASADYMLLLSADDYLLPGALSRAAALMNKHPEVGFTFGNGFEPGSEIADLRRILPVSNSQGWRIVTGVEFIELSGPYNIVCTPTAIVRSELQKRLGGYRHELPHSGDMEMWLRFAAHASVGILICPQAVYRRHFTNMSKAYMTRGWLPDLRQRKQAFDFLFEHHGNLLPDACRLRHRLLRSLARCAIGFASMAFNEGEMAISNELVDFASETDPDITTSIPWMKLTCKRALGLRAWRLLTPAVRALLDQ